jgi:hypothetical protein
MTYNRDLVFCLTTPNGYLLANRNSTDDQQYTNLVPKPGPKIPNIYFNPHVRDYPGSAGPARTPSYIKSNFVNKFDN